MKVLEAQIIGSFIICAATFGVAMAVFGVLNAMELLRISKEGEEEGMDLHEHGISAYPEYVISSLAAPKGMPRDTVGYLPVSADAKSAKPNSWLRPSDPYCGFPTHLIRGLNDGPAVRSGPSFSRKIPWRQTT